MVWLCIDCDCEYDETHLIHGNTRETELCFSCYVSQNGG